MTGEPCFECGAPADCAHHVVPAAAGGTRTVPLCDRCHELAHDKRVSSRALTLEGLRRRKLRGERTGSVPLGFRLAADGQTLEVDEGEAAAIREARRLRGEGRSLRRVAADLEELGFVARSGRRFEPMQIRRMLDPSEAELLELGEF